MRVFYLCMCMCVCVVDICMCLCVFERVNDSHIKLMCWLLLLLHAVAFPLAELKKKHGTCMCAFVCMCVCVCVYV